MSILDTQVLQTEIVLQPQVVANSYVIVEIHESIQNRFVRAEIEMSPFETETQPDGFTRTRGIGGRRNILVWQNAEYDEVRDTWNNLDLIAKVATLVTNS